MVHPTLLLFFNIISQNRNTGPGTGVEITVSWRHMIVSHSSEHLTPTYHTGNICTFSGPRTFAEGTSKFMQQTSGSMTCYKTLEMNAAHADRDIRTWVRSLWY